MLQEHTFEPINEGALPLPSTPMPIEPAYVARLEERMQRLEDALLLINGVPTHTRADITVLDVTQWVSFQTGMAVKEIVGPRRLAPVVRARFAVYWISVYALQLSLPQVGRKLSRRDHTTVLMGCRRANEFREKDPAFRMMTDKGLRHFTALIADAIMKASEAAKAAAAAAEQLEEEDY